MSAPVIAAPDFRDLALSYFAQDETALRAELERVRHERDVYRDGWCVAIHERWAEQLAHASLQKQHRELQQEFRSFRERVMASAVAA